MQTLGIRQLSKRHAQVLVVASELLDLVFPAIAGDAATEGSKGKMRHDLRNNKFAGVHWMSWQSDGMKPTCYEPISDRDQTNSPNYFVRSNRYDASFV